MWKNTLTQENEWRQFLRCPEKLKKKTSWLIQIFTSFPLFRFFNHYFKLTIKRTGGLSSFSSSWDGLGSLSGHLGGNTIRFGCSSTRVTLLAGELAAKGDFFTAWCGGPSLFLRGRLGDRPRGLGCLLAANREAPDEGVEASTWLCGGRSKGRPQGHTWLEPVLDGVFKGKIMRLE